MLGLTWVIIFLLAFGVLFYQRASLVVFTLSFALLLIFLSESEGLSIPLVVSWLVFFTLFGLLNVKPWRRRIISRPILNLYQKVMPTMSHTEREAIAAGTVTWEGDLFRGNPNWRKLLSHPQGSLTEEERVFLEGPVEELCRMIDDWDITHNRSDLPPEMWKFKI